MSMGSVRVRRVDGVVIVIGEEAMCERKIDAFSDMIGFQNDPSFLKLRCGIDLFSYLSNRVIILSKRLLIRGFSLQRLLLYYLQPLQWKMYW